MWRAKDDVFTFQIEIPESNKPFSEYDHHDLRPPSVPVTIYCQSQAVNAVDLVGRSKQGV